MLQCTLQQTDKDTLVFSVTNKHNKKLLIEHYNTPLESVLINFTVTNNGKRVKYYIPRVRRKEFTWDIAIKLAPGETFSREHKNFSKWYDMSQKGDYMVEVPKQLRVREDTSSNDIYVPTNCAPIVINV